MKKERLTNSFNANSYPTAIRAYVMPWDTGLAPNISNDICTLAVCKPNIRKYTQLGKEWVLAVGAIKTLMHVNDGKKQYENWKNRLVYAMAPEERMSFEAYHHDPRFSGKIPHSEDDPGDNIYYMDESEKRYKPVEHIHTIHKINENLKPLDDFTRNDLSAPMVLIANKFWYWGENAPVLEETGLKSETVERIMSVRRGHIRIEEPEIIKDIADWLQSRPSGVHGAPRQRHLGAEIRSFMKPR